MRVLLHRFTIAGLNSFTMGSQTTLLRIGAFLVDALSLSLLLILPTSAVSYGVAWIGGSVKAIQIAWLVALGILLVGLLIRDGYKGRSIGKHLLGLRLVTKSGAQCGYIRSIIRNLPLIVPVWNFLEVLLVMFGKPRTGDRIARTLVTEE
jgi:uncharacterized RDD family membrane protein YckC